MPNFERSTPLQYLRKYYCSLVNYIDKQAREWLNADISM